MLSEAFATAAGAAGIQRKVTPHTLRQSEIPIASIAAHRPAFVQRSFCGGFAPYKLFSEPAEAKEIATPRPAKAPRRRGARTP